KNMQMARVVIRVTMEKDGKKVVAVRSSIDIHNQLPHQLAVFSAEEGKELMLIEPSQSKPVPLPFAHCQFMVRPEGCFVQEKNLLPIDVEIRILDHVLPVAAGKQLLITTVDITKTLAIRVITDRLRTVQECYISKSGIGEGQLVSL
ncbi:hypothetical protein ANCCEY_15451, partial [Ancylostoma ceylanicum]